MSSSSWTDVSRERLLYRRVSRVHTYHRECFNRATLGYKQLHYFNMSWIAILRSHRLWLRYLEVQRAESTCLHLDSDQVAAQNIWEGLEGKDKEK